MNFFFQLIKNNKGTFRRQWNLTSSIIVSLIGLNVRESSCCWLKNELSNKIGLNIESIDDENDGTEDDDDDVIFDWNIGFIFRERKIITRLTKAEWRRLGLLVAEDFFERDFSRFNSCSSVNARIDFARFFD